MSHDSDTHATRWLDRTLFATGSIEEWILECESYSVEIAAPCSANATARHDLPDMFAEALHPIRTDESQAAKKAFKQIQSFSNDDSTAM